MYVAFGALVVWIVVASVRAGSQMRADLEAFAGGFPWQRGPLPQMPPADSTGGARVSGTLRGPNGAPEHVIVRFINGYRGAPSTTSVGLLVGDGPTQKYNYPWITIIPAQEFPRTFAWQVGDGVRTGQPEFDARYRMHVYVSFGALGGPTMLSGTYPLAQELMRLLLAGRRPLSVSYDGKFAYVSWRGHEVRNEDVQEALAVLRLFMPMIPGLHTTIRGSDRRA